MLLEPDLRFACRCSNELLDLYLYIYLTNACRLDSRSLLEAYQIACLGKYLAGKRSNYLP